VNAPDTQDRLEAGEIVRLPRDAVPLPTGEARALLLASRCARLWKNINFAPATGRLRGAARNAAQLQRAMAEFSSSATRVLASELPRLAASWTPDQATFRPIEEQGRRLPTVARNDLVHVDAFPGRPSRGRRILRLFVNVHPDRPRVWRTGPSFAELLFRHGPTAGLNRPTPTRLRRWAEDRGWIRRRSDYDAFMLRFHDYLKAADAAGAIPTTAHIFEPGTAWVTFTDAVAHAVVSGQHALEHSYFVGLDALRNPALAPASLYERARAEVGS